MRERILSVGLVVTWLATLTVLTVAVERHHAAQPLQVESNEGGAGSDGLHFVSKPVLSKAPGKVTITWATTLPCTYRITYGRRDPYELTGPSSNTPAARQEVVLSSFEFPEIYRWAVMVTDRTGNTLIEEIGEGQAPREELLEIVRGDGVGPLLNPGNLAAGCAWWDYDGDGDPDVFLCGGPGESQSRNRLLRNDGGTFTDVTDKLPPQAAAAWSLSASWGDFDADGLPDLLVLGQTLVLLRNGGPPDFVFKDVSALAGFSYGGLFRSGTLSDLDNDGLPDIALLKAYHGLIAYRNLGRGAPLFEDVTPVAALPKIRSSASYYVRSFVPADLDGDGRTDLLLNVPGLEVSLQTAPWHFAGPSKESEPRVRPAGPLPAAAVGDVNQDGLPDLYVPPFPSRRGLPAGELLIQGPAGTFTPRTNIKDDLSRFSIAAESAQFCDVNLDGIDDLVIGTSAAGIALFLGGRDGRFTDTAGSFLPEDARVGRVRGVSLVDFDGDGTPDIFVLRSGQPNLLLRNRFKPAPGMGLLVVTLQGKRGISNAAVRLLAAEKKRIREYQITGGDGGGSQSPAAARFAVPEADYTVAVRFSDGKIAEVPVHVKAQEVVRRVISHD